MFRAPRVYLGSILFRLLAIPSDENPAVCLALPVSREPVACRPHDHPLQRGCCRRFRDVHAPLQRGPSTPHVISPRPHWRATRRPESSSAILGLPAATSDCSTFTACSWSVLKGGLPSRCHAGAGKSLGLGASVCFLTARVRVRSLAPPRAHGLGVDSRSVVSAFLSFRRRTRLGLFVCCA